MKKILIKLTVGLALSISWIAIYQATIHAATMTNPKITTVQQYTPKQALVTKSQSNNYLWNASHTKKIANLKNYSKTTFYASRLVSMRFPHYQYSVNYYYVTSNNSKLKGYVWAKTMVQGKYIKGGYYSYPKFNVLLTTKRITKQSEFSDSSQYSLGGYSTRTSLQNFTKIPSTSSMIKVINYYRQPYKMAINRVSKLRLSNHGPLILTALLEFQ